MGKVRFWISEGELTSPPEGSTVPGSLKSRHNVANPVSATYESDQFPPEWQERARHESATAP